MEPKEKKAFEPSGLVPRSIVRTFGRFRQQLLPGSEKTAIREYRISRYQVLVSARCLFSLLTIPIVTNWLVSSWFLSPIIEHFWNTQQTEIFLNSYQEERAFAELEFFSEKLFFESLLKTTYKNDVKFSTDNALNKLWLQSTTNMSPTTLLPLKVQQVQQAHFGSLENCKTEESSKSLREEWSQLITNQTNNLSSVQSISPKGVIKNRVIDMVSTSFPSCFAASYPVTPSSTTLSDLLLASLLCREQRSYDSWQSPAKEAEEIISNNTSRTILNKVSIDCPVFRVHDTEKPPNHDQKRFVNSVNSSLTKIAQSPSISLRQKPKDFIWVPSLVLSSSFANDLAEQKVDATPRSFYSWQSNESSLVFDQPTAKSNEIELIDRFSRIIAALQPVEKEVNIATLLQVYDNLPKFVNVNIEDGDQEIDSLKIKEKIQEKILELAIYYNQQTILSITNVIGDLVSILTLICLFVWMRPEITILKSFLIEAIYSLSDTTKSFLLILLTDLLVGFHSPRGWETALELLLKHFGLPENQDFVFLFVATFPVLLDTVFKYWIFRHLNKISPSTVATYHSMIE